MAISLAEEGGFENVKQRDVAARAGVALGTLYKAFRSKEEILSAALEKETVSLEQRLTEQPMAAPSILARVTEFFALCTAVMVEKPNYARAVLRAISSGVPEVAARVTAYNERMTRMTIAALRGVAPTEELVGTDDENELATIFQQVWFASLVGWSAGNMSPAEIEGHMARVAERLL